MNIHFTYVFSRHAVKGKLNGDPCFAKVIEDLLGKAGKLENDLLR